MTTFLEILKYVLPSLVVFLTVYVMLRSYFDFRHKSNVIKIGNKNQEIVLPLRLQAYERLALLMERISPPQAVFRVLRPEMSSAQFQTALIQSIREEYEHNIAQQIYVSPELWGLIKTAREEVIRMANTTFISMNDNGSASELAQKILEEWSKPEKNAVQQTVDYLKNEVKQLF